MELMLLGLLLVALLGAATVWMARDTFARSGRMGINLRSVCCPSCRAPVPLVRKPRNVRQALWGGWTCDKCGAEMDKWGKPLAPKSKNTT